MRQSTARASVLSSAKLRFGATLLVVLLIAATSTMTIGLVTRIFSRLTPAMQTELEWKTRSTAVLLADRLQLGILLDDEALVRSEADRVLSRGDVLRVVAADTKGALLVQIGVPAEGDAFAGPPGVLRWTAGDVSAWSESIVEGRVVGKVAVYVSTAPLKAGEELRREMVVMALAAAAVGLIVSLAFVNGRLVPLLRVTESALHDLEKAAVGLAAKERLEKELEIGANIQASILPPNLALLGAEISAGMRPATEVGGDYYDVLPATGGCWIGIGDVAGHGVTAGIIMLMVQSIVAALTRYAGDAEPQALLPALNAVLHDNIRNRLRLTEHVTFSLLRYYDTGELIVAGAHEDIVVYRARTGRCEQVPTCGTWLGAIRDVSNKMPTQTLQLGAGDVVVLYTDGITEAMDEGGRMFGLDRLCSVVEAHGRQSAQAVRDALFTEVGRFSVAQDDDRSVVVLRHGELGAS